MTTILKYKITGLTSRIGSDFAGDDNWINHPTDENIRDSDAALDADKE